MTQEIWLWDRSVGVAVTYWLACSETSLLQSNNVCRQLAPAQNITKKFQFFHNADVIFFNVDIRMNMKKRDFLYKTLGIFIVCTTDKELWQYIVFVQGLHMDYVTNNHTQYFKNMTSKKISLEILTIFFPTSEIIRENHMPLTQYSAWNRTYEKSLLIFSLEIRSFQVKIMGLNTVNLRMNIVKEIKTWHEIFLIQICYYYRSHCLLNGKFRSRTFI